jgi:hypothetical protein
MARKIKIKWATSNYTLGRIDAIRVRIESVCAEGMPTKIFAYRMLPKNPATGASRGYFSHICSPVDLEDYPEDAPIPTHVPKWFRLGYVDVLLRSEIEAEAFIRDVRGDVLRLKRSLDAVDAVFERGTDDLGTGIVCETPSSSSASVESSSSTSSESLGPVQSVTATGTFEQNVGFGQPWTAIGTGAGSPIGSLDSISATARNASRVTLPAGLVSRMLLIQGFDLDALPADAVLQGITAKLVARDATLLGSSGQSASSAAVVGPRLFFFRLYDPERGLVGDNKANNDLVYGPDWTEWTFGDDNDRWNAGISVNTLRTRGDFGVGLVVGVDDTSDDAVVDVDGVELEIFYR